MSAHEGTPVWGEVIRHLREATEVLKDSNDCALPEMPQIEREEYPMWNPATETIDEFMVRANHFAETGELWGPK